MTTFTALGDSITLGLGDPVPSGGWRGWAVFLAEGLPGPHRQPLAEDLEDRVTGHLSDLLERAPGQRLVEDHGPLERSAPARLRCCDRDRPASAGTRTRAFVPGAT